MRFIRKSDVVKAGLSTYVKIIDIDNEDCLGRFNDFESAKEYVEEYVDDCDGDCALYGYEYIINNCNLSTCIGIYTYNYGKWNLLDSMEFQYE